MKRENCHIQFVLLIVLFSICITGPLGHLKLYNEGNTYLDGLLHGFTFLVPGGYDHVYPITDVAYALEIVFKIVIFLFLTMTLWRFTYKSDGNGNIGYLSIVVILYIVCTITFGVLLKKEKGSLPRDAANDAMDTALMRGFDPSTVYGKAQFFTSVVLVLLGVYLFIRRETMISLSDTYSGAKTSITGKYDNYIREGRQKRFDNLKQKGFT